jgi:hypothetical protein
LIGVQMVQVPRDDTQRHFDAIRHLTYAALGSLERKRPRSPSRRLSISARARYRPM